MTFRTKPTDFVYVPLSVETYAELVKRSKTPDVSAYIEHSVEKFLDETKDHGLIWSSEYTSKLAEERGEGFWDRDRCGDPVRGYQWQNVFLPNGTQVRMMYRKQASYGEIRHEKLFLDERNMSPSEFARRVANNTTRNAWRDIYVNFPGGRTWKLADDLRRQATDRAPF